jgi:hypothetical protein
MQVPGSKYKIEKGENLTRPKVFELKIYPAKDDKNKYKIKKSKEPDMGTYNHIDSYKKTQLYGYE